MKIHAVCLLVAAIGFSAPTLAQDISFDEIVGQSGLSKQDVRMVLGARTPYPAYRTSYERVRRQLIEAVGQARYQELVAAAAAGRLETSVYSAG